MQPLGSTTLTACIAQKFTITRNEGSIHETSSTPNNTLPLYPSLAFDTTLPPRTHHAHPSNPILRSSNPQPSHTIGSPCASPISCATISYTFHKGIPQNPLNLLSAPCIYPDLTPPRHIRLPSLEPIFILKV
ncbi:hypothetical protein CC78DRAFT_279690 [Lojkania enalia]|uniref:Uncharacterized protein n=1 Tax=Lojkania enalia TaxID=147567 RepID=A0A9P4NA40_9PLEO|nr:hypothetical protein CC78DRAFT_279690 [Didymosphaeria enalia]